MKTPPPADAAIAIDHEHDAAYVAALHELWDRSDYDRGFVSNPFAGDSAARLGLRRTAALLDRLGDPRSGYPILHVAGSKGKGSTCAFAHAILTAAGLRTGLYTSPHLHSFRERIVVDRDPISERAFADSWQRVKAASRDVEATLPEIGRPTAFELTTAMALDYFSREGCEAAVVEVGLGGTLDATNVVMPASTAIAALDFEHTRVLGTTMPEIAANKAGIVKPGVPLATATLPSDAVSVVAQAVAEAGAPWLRAGEEWLWNGTWQNFTLMGPWGRFERLRSGLMGAHQVENAGLAVAACIPILGSTLTEQVARAGIGSVRLAGRFEVVRNAGRIIVLDVAHTASSARALAATVAAEFPGREATVILGVLRDKDPFEIANELAAVAERIVAVTPHGPRALPVMDLSLALTELTVPVDMGMNVESALSVLDAGVVLVTGSFAMVAAARESLGLGVRDPLEVS